MREDKDSFKKHKRRFTKPLTKELIGKSEGGKLFYPSSVKSGFTNWRDYRIRKFIISTHYTSVLTGTKKTLEVAFWFITNADSKYEYLGIESHSLPLFAKKGTVEKSEKDIYIPTSEPQVAKAPRRIVVPHRKTLDNHGLNVALFQRDNYLGIPLCVTNLDKKDITFGWVHIYNTVIDGIEGIYFESEHAIPLSLWGNIQLI